MTRILPGLFAMLLSLSLGGQYIQVEHLNTEQGLPTEEINGLLATADHYLWLATNHGLYRHDGYQYQPIAFPPPPLGPPSSQAYRIEPMGTEQFYLLFLNHGFGIYNFRSAQFEYFSHEPGDPTSLPSNFVQSIIDDGPQAWLSFDRGGFGRFDKASCTFNQYLPSVLLPAVKRLDETLSLALDPHRPNLLWVSSANGLMAFDKETEQLRHFDNEANGSPLPSASFRQLVIDGKGLLYASTWNDGVWCFDTHQEKWLGALPAGEKAGLTCVNYIGFRQPGELWISDEFLGLFRYSIEGGQLRLAIPSHINEAPVVDPDFRLKSSIMDMEQGPFGVWWGIQRRKGLAAIYPSKQLFPRYHFPEEGRCAARRPNQPYLYINTNGALLYRMDLRTGLLKTIPIDVVGNDALNFSQCQCTPDGRFWLIGREAIYFYEEGARAARPLLLPQIEAALDSAWADSFLWDSQGQLWLGTNQGLLFVAPRQGQSRWITFSDTLESKTTQWRGFTDILESPGGRIWFACDRGFGFTDDNGLTFTRYNFQNPTSKNIEFVNVYALARDSTGRIWLGSRDRGLGYVMDKGPHPQVIQIINTEDGLKSTQVRDIAVDRQGRIWVLQDNGLSRLDPITLKPIQFGAGYGKSLARSFYLSALSDGQMVLGSGSGFHLFYPESIEPDLRFYPVRMEGLRVFDSLYLSDYSLAAKPAIELNYRQNFFTIEFAAPHYGAPGPIQYQYMLDGLDDNWRTAGGNRYAAFSNVWEGDYTFRVRAANSLGEWSDKHVSSLRISITPPWWRTWWFISLVLAVLAGLVYLAYRLRIRAIKKEEALKTAFNRKVAELEMQALRAQMNPHFLFNSLQSIKWYLINHSTAESADYLDKFAQLIRKILQNTDSKLIRLSEELEAMELYLQLEQYRFKGRFDYEIRLEAGVPADFARVPPLLFQPFIENAIWHGLMQKECGKGLLQIQIKKQGEGLLINIRDNGVGREKARLLKSRSASKHQSFGIKLSEGRLETLNRIMGIAAHVKIIDLKNQDQAPSGTLVQIYLPTIL
ncbi:MAG: histidine kinase [Lewinellaceae bacterium]|nr:histidine kinase [Lewinellaceae bacterium]